MDQRLGTVLSVAAFAMIAWQQARIGDLEQRIAKLDERSFIVFADRAIQIAAVDNLTKRQSALKDALVDIGARVIGKTRAEVEEEIIRTKVTKQAAGE